MLRRLPTRLSSSITPSTTAASIRRVHTAFSVQTIESRRPRPPLEDLYRSEQKKYTLARTGHMVPEGGVLPSMLREFRQKVKEERHHHHQQEQQETEAMEQVMQIRNRMVHDSDSYHIRDHASRKIQRRQEQ